MSRSTSLLSLRFAFAFRQSIVKASYGRSDFSKDLLAGITIGIIAIPLSMALAIASGVAPQHGLYTAVIAGFIISLTGGSRFNISGPTAAFVVILLPITNTYGLAGLLLASMMAGMILIGMAVLRLGRLIEYIPNAVTLGFTGGIGIVIASLQISDFLGLNLSDLPGHFLPKLQVIAGSLSLLSIPSTIVAALTLLIMIFWRRLNLAIPAHLPALVVGTAVATVFIHQGYPIDTIGSRFDYLLPDGSKGYGIPPFLPHFIWPWEQSGADGTVLDLSWALLANLLPSAFAIAMLGAIESLLCAVILDGMSGKRHSANSELLGQGLGNIIAPLFGGITATAALARSAANYKAGAVSPIAGMIHALVVLSAILLFSSWLAYLPMPSMAALLLIVAWNMSEARKAVDLIKSAPLRDILVFSTCLILTVLLDMVVAITVGVLLAALLFVQEIAKMTRVSNVSDNQRLLLAPLPKNWAVFKINGPLFFAAADRVLSEIQEQSEGLSGVIFYMEGVTILDAGGLETLRHFIEHSRQEGKTIIFTDLQFQPLKTLARAKFKPIDGVIQFYSTLDEAISYLTSESNSHGKDQIAKPNVG